MLHSESEAQLAPSTVESEMVKQGIAVQLRD
jgi:hypothetical protein